MRTKYVILISCVLMQSCLGGLYAWSSFVPELRSIYALSAAQTQLLFGCLILVFTAAMVYAGRALRRWRPSLLAGSGGVLFGVGYLAASYSGGEFFIMLLGIGLLAGVGTGFCYVCALSLCAEWFPNRKGLATGIAVAGFGGGAVLLSFLSEILFAQGRNVLEVFRVVGPSYAVLIVLAASVLRFPSGEDLSRPGELPTLRIIIKDRFLRGLFLSMFAGTFGGLLVIGNLKPMALSKGLTAQVAAVGISLFAVGNASGRIAWGWITDRIALKAIPLSLFLLAMSLLVMISPTLAATHFVIVSAAIGFGFGACFVVYATVVGARYGAANVATMYPPVFVAYGISGIAGPWTCGWLFDVTSSFTPGVLAGVAVIVLGALAGGRYLSFWTKQTASV